MMPIRCGQCQRVLADLDMASIERMITLRCPGCHARVAIRPAPAPVITAVPTSTGASPDMTQAGIMYYPPPIVDAVCALTDDGPIGMIVKAPA